MELLKLKLKRVFGKLFGFSFLIGLLVAIFMFSGIIFLNFKRIGAFCYVYMGDKYSQKHEYQEAIDYYKRALELYPGHIKARYNLGNIYVAYEDYESAIDCYQNVLLYDPNYINARINLGIILAEEEANVDGAINEYTKAIQTQIPVIKIPLIYDNSKLLKDEKAIAYYDMGLAYRDKSLLYSSDSFTSRDFLMKAVDCYKESIANNPDSYDSQYNLALTYQLLNMHSEALEGYCKAMVLAPLNYEAYYNLAVLLKQKGQYKEAVEQFQRAGYLSGYDGDTHKSAFIYQVLNEVNIMAIARNDIENKKDLGKDIVNPEMKAVTEEELKEVLIDRIKTSNVCKAYIENSED